MVTDQKKKATIDVLNTLVETCLDAHDGYQTAAHHVENMKVKKLFGRFALERKHFAEELGGEIRNLGGTPRERGSAAGALHRGWMELTSNMSEPLHGDVLKECVRGENTSLRHYEDAIDGGLPGDIKRLVERQLGNIAYARDRVVEIEGG